MPSKIDNIIIQVRSRLQELGIKLWLDPYYFDDIGPIESEIDRLAREFSSELKIPYDYCRAAISELQDGALTKLRARKEFQDTGLATFKIRAVQNGKTNVLTVKCKLTDTGKTLHEKVADGLKVEIGKIKLISSGRVIQYESRLENQGLVNNQQIMGLVSPQSANTEDDIYDRVRKAKEDAELIITSKRQNFFTMEDQDGNAVHLPPYEREAIMLALALYEKGKSAMKKEKYDEALVLFLEADEQFSSCDSKILDSVDNYALLNLDIVWCYLCLKSVTHLPDAERRLNICEQSFRKSYGENFHRLIALKGSSENEKALVMRLHLLQGVVLFHQNRRNEAHEKLSIAETELRGLKVDEISLATLIEMGYNLAEGRIALRACNGNMDEAVCYITDRRQKRKEARKKSKKENEVSKGLSGSQNEEWVNPRSVCTLVGMGFQKEYVTAALKKAKNDLTMALDLLQNNRDSLIPDLPAIDVDTELVTELVKIGFDPEVAKIALESTFNNSQEAIDLLLKLEKDGNFNQLFSTLTAASNEQVMNDQPGPSTDMNKKNDIKTVLKQKISQEMTAMMAYERFSEDISIEEDEYLDLPLVQEENILLEYKTLLEQ